MHSSNRNQFEERSSLSCFGESSEILSMSYVVLKGYLYDPIDCIRPAVAIERGKYTEKTVLFNFDYLYISSFLFLDIYFYILVLVSSTISYRSRLCEFFLPWWTVGTSPTFFSLWTEEKGGSAGRGLYHERSTEVNPLQIWNMDSGNATELGPHIDPNESVFLQRSIFAY